MTSSDGLDQLRERLRHIPSEPGVYRFVDGDGVVLYVGKAKELHKRVSSYLRAGGPVAGRTAEMVSRARDIEWVVTGSEQEALLVEDDFIKQSRPPYNVRLRDDKSYPYIEITLSDQWPRVRFMRGEHKAGNLYFGPYSSAKKVREMLDLIGRIFPYRKCQGVEPGRKSGSPCLQNFIKRSLGPCDDRCTHREYMEVIDEVVAFLRGQLREVERRIAAEMKAAAAAQEFEKAALLRDRLAAVRHVAERQVVRTEGAGDFDVIGLHQGDPGGNVQVFRIRDGSLVDRQSFYLENTDGRERDRVLDEFLMEYYWTGNVVPPEVIVDVDGMNDLAALLTDRRGAGVRVRRAQRGPKRRLLELAGKNARLAAEADAERRAHGREAREEALRRLRDALALPGLPLRIECYDISNLGEESPVGSMVVFESGRPKRAHYRTFAVRGVEGQDDFAMMREVVRRRLARRVSAAETPAPVAGSGGSAAARAVAAAAESPEGAGGPAAGTTPVDGAVMTITGAPAYDESFAALPDLILIDGGKGQLSAAEAGMREAGVEVRLASLAKQREEVFVPGRPDPLPLPADDPASLLLQRVRDEAHRFAVTFHRKRRGAGAHSSVLDEIDGIGPVRRRRIVEHFGSPERVLAATREELEAVPGLPRKIAREVHAQLHKTG